MFLQLKEAGAGYWAEKNGVLFVCPNAVVRQNDEQAFHSETHPAIAWKNGLQIFYLDGVNFEEKMWRKILSKKMTFAEIMQIESADEKAVALKYNPEAIIREGAELVDESTRGNQLYKIENREINKFLDEPEIWFLRMTCPTGRVFVEGVEPKLARANKSADFCQAYALGLDLRQYRNLRMEG